MNEPTITINGTKCSIGQAMTLRVALECFAFDLVAGLGNDQIGEQITSGYRDRIAELRAMMLPSSIRLVCFHCRKPVAKTTQPDSGYEVDVFFHVDENGKSLGVYCADGKHHVTPIREAV